MATGRLRVGAVGVVTMFAVVACGGGFGGASRAPPSDGRAAAPRSAAAEASPSESAAEPVTLTIMVGEVETTVDERPGADRRLHRAPPERDLRHRDGSERDRGRQPRQDAARHRRDDRHLLVQLGLAAPGAEPANTLVDLSGEPSSPTSTSRSSRPCPSVTRSSACRPVRPWAAASSTTRRSSQTTASRCPRRGRSSRPTTKSSRRPVSRRSVRPCGTDTWTSQLFVLADHCNVEVAVPDFAEQYTANQIHYATPRPPEGLRAPAGGLREGLVAGGLRRRHIR